MTPIRFNAARPQPTVAQRQHSVQPKPPTVSFGQADRIDLSTLGDIADVRALEKLQPGIRRFVASTEADARRETFNTLCKELVAATPKVTQAAVKQLISGPDSNLSMSQSVRLLLQGWNKSKNSPQGKAFFQQLTQPLSLDRPSRQYLEILSDTLIHTRSHLDAPFDTLLLAHLKQDKPLLNASLLSLMVDRQDVGRIHRLGQTHPEILNTFTPSGSTPLINAATKGQLRSVKALLKAGAQPDTKDSKGQTALMLAAQNGHQDVITALVNAGANVDLQDNEEHTALMLAATAGQLQAIHTLSELNANLDITDEAGNTALIGAAEAGQTEVVKALIKARAALDVQNDHGRTALMEAAGRGKPETVQALVDAEAALDLQDEQGYTALMLAASHEDVVQRRREMATAEEILKTAEILVEAGADLKIRNNQRRRAYKLATPYSALHKTLKPKWFGRK